MPALLQRRGGMVGAGLALWVALGLVACGPRADGGQTDGGGGPEASVPDGHVWWDGGVGPDGGDPCEPPDMLIVLDRTMSMHRMPDGDPTPQASHDLSKWYLAIDGVETVTAAYDLRLRFGLELFPRDPADGSCVTLTERIDGTTASNVICEAGEVLVSPDVGTSGAIDSAMDAETTLLCRSTPIGEGLDTALAHLAGIQDPIRSQFVLLVTDGGETCNDPVWRVQDLAAAGVSTFVVGFDGSGAGVDPEVLNNMACAGLTAPDPAQNCVDQGGGAYVAADPAGATLFLTAEDGPDLAAQLESVAAAVGCIVE